MLTLFSKHGLMDLELTAKGDIEVDYHHTVEDTGILLGQAIAKALGDKAGIVEKSGSWFSYDGTRIGQGRENAKQFLQENPEIMIEISERIRTQMGIGDSLDKLDDLGADLVELDPDEQPISLDD